MALRGWEQPKTSGYFGWECGVQSSQSRVPSKSPAFFWLECGLQSKNFGVPNALINITLYSYSKLTIHSLISFGPSWLLFGSGPWSWFWILVQMVSDLYYSDRDMQCLSFCPPTHSPSDYMTPHKKQCKECTQMNLHIMDNHRLILEFVYLTLLTIPISFTLSDRLYICIWTSFIWSVMSVITFHFNPCPYILITWWMWRCRIFWKWMQYWWL